MCVKRWDGQRASFEEGARTGTQITKKIGSDVGRYEERQRSKRGGICVTDVIFSGYVM